MSIICSVDYSTALPYKGANLSTKYNNKKHRVYLKLICDDFTLTDGIELAKASKNIVMIDYQGLDTNPAYLGLTSDTGVYIGRVVTFGNNITIEDIQRIVEDTPNGVTPIISLPNDYKDLKFIWEVSQKFERLRFCGGYLFAVDGVRIGAVGVDLLTKLDIKFDESSYLLDGKVDVLEDVSISGLDIDVSTKPVKVAKERKASSSSSTQKKSTKKQSISFSSIIRNSGFNGGI